MKHVNGSESRTKVTGVQEGDVQSNAIDIRLGKVFLVRPKTFVISEDTKIHRGSAEISPDENGWYTLPVGTYEIAAENTIEVGEGEAGWVVTRSTLNRNGVFITSGLYDSGYSGGLLAAMHVTAGPMKIQQGTRIAQYISFEAEMLHAYNGSYGFGTADDVAYGVKREDSQQLDLPLEKAVPKKRTPRKKVTTDGN